MKKITFLIYFISILGYSQYTKIPDTNFEQALIDIGIDTNTTIDGKVLTANISEVTYLDVGDKNIIDLTGIEAFTALNRLFCNNNQLTSLDVRNGNKTASNYFRAKGNPNLSYILVNDTFCSFVNWKSLLATATFANNASECVALSMADKLPKLGVSIYPNPTDSTLFIEGNKNPIAVSIYNILGKEVLSAKNTNNIDVRAISSGVYMIRITDGVRQTNRKFVKN